MGWKRNRNMINLRAPTKHPVHRVAEFVLISLNVCIYLFIFNFLWHFFLVNVTVIQHFPKHPSNQPSSTFWGRVGGQECTVKGKKI